MPRPLTLRQVFVVFLLRYHPIWDGIMMGEYVMIGGSISAVFCIVVFHITSNKWAVLVRPYFHIGGTEMNECVGVL